MMGGKQFRREDNGYLLTLLVLLLGAFAITAFGLALAAFLRTQNDALPQINAIRSVDETQQAQIDAALGRLETTFGTLGAPIAPPPLTKVWNVQFTGAAASYLTWGPSGLATATITQAGTYCTGFSFVFSLNPTFSPAAFIEVTPGDASPPILREDSVGLSTGSSTLYKGVLTSKFVLTEAQVPATIKYTILSQSSVPSYITQIFESPLTEAWVTKVI